jgi:DNA-directed RNA polymerase subunit RPC12/RpoP
LSPFRELHGQSRSPKLAPFQPMAPAQETRLRCPVCEGVGVPHAVSVGPDAAVTLSLRCNSCGHRWDVKQPPSFDPLFKTPPTG